LSSAGTHLSVALSSNKVAWKGIIAEVHRFPALDPLAHRAQRHDLALQLSPPTTLEWKTGRTWQNQQVVPGNLSFCPAGAETMHRWQDDIALLLLSLDPFFLARVAHETLGCDRIEFINQYGAIDPHIQHLGLALKAELETGGMNGKLYGESIAIALSVHLLRRYNVQPQMICNPVEGLAPRVLKQAITFIEANLNQDLSLSRLASEVHMSPYHFARGFKQATGLTPHQYVTQQRLEYAKRLLAQHSFSIGDVAYQCGFDSQSHFTMLFRRWVGVTPKLYHNSL
jgi:AraC family transcriptional regulator